MANEVILNNYSDDSRIKEYVSNVLMPKVFHDIPLNVLNTGHLSIINEYMSQALEQQAYTSSFFFNEAFITKAVLADSIYSEAAKFNIGYSYATPSSCNFLLELRIEDIYNNAILNPDNGLYEFVLDKNTKFNLSNGNVYSLDWDIIIQYKSIDTSNLVATIPAWNIQYINTDEMNSVATNKNMYILYRVTDVWLCLFVQASEYERQTYTIVNNMTNGIPNEDKVITLNNHIAGFDIKYIDSDGTYKYIPHDHILPIHSDVTDSDPYIHYIMDSPQTIRFMFQLNGNKYFVPKLNSSYEITVYTCHGESANFTAYKSDEEQPLVITASNKYSNNANVMKTAFVVSGSLGGTNIGTVETTRRETIEAYNTANVISTDHDMYEWFSTFFFKNILYPFFFKRRDDPWGRIWSGYLALKDTDDYIFRTNTLHGKIPYDILYSNNDNIESSNEIIIPPGWIWIYNNENNYTVTPYTNNGNIIETAKTLANLNEKFVFSNPFGIRIQKDPFAIGYFNPWINDYVTCTKLPNSKSSTEKDTQDLSYIYHATPIVSNIKRTYRDDHYTLTTFISPTVAAWIDGSALVRYVRQNAVAPIFANVMWNYFKEPLDMFTPNIPILPLTADEGFLPFDPENTFLCVREKNRIDDEKWSLKDIWIQDYSSSSKKDIFIPITGNITMFYGDDYVWGDTGLHVGHEVYVTGDTGIYLYPEITSTSKIKFDRIATHNYYEMRLGGDSVVGTIEKIVVGEATETEYTKYGERSLVQIGKKYAPSIQINIYFNDGTNTTYTISNAATVYMPYAWNTEKSSEGSYVFDFANVGCDGIILYADMRPTPDAGAIDYYRVPLSLINKNRAIFYIANKLLPVEENNMRVILHAMVNGAESGHVEMQPVSKESDGSYQFQVTMYPLNELVDIDNRINIASTSNGGGSWISTNASSVVNVDATEPEFKLSVLIRSLDSMRDSDISIGDSYTGFRLVDQYTFDDLNLVQELKEMRSVVDFGESSKPTDAQKSLYNNMISLCKYDSLNDRNINTLTKYAYSRMNGSVKCSYSLIQTISKEVYTKLTEEYFVAYKCVSSVIPDALYKIATVISTISNNANEGNTIDWSTTWSTLYSYKDTVNSAFASTNINGGIMIQLMPFVEYSLMNSDRFESFVSSFTQVHNALEPVIMKRLEGNNYLDCKLIATYGLPHSYSSDTDQYIEGVYWPDLNVQVEFNVKLYNASLATNTINELKLIIKSYFNRLTSIHTPIDMISMNNNIYISHVIQQMEQHSNVAYMKFLGWYTSEKANPDGSYMDANQQAIVQKRKKFEDFTKKELESFTPEMFVLDDKNIVINLI